MRGEKNEISHIWQNFYCEKQRNEKSHRGKRGRERENQIKNGKRKTNGKNIECDKTKPYEEKYSELAENELNKAKMNKWATSI